MHTPFYWLWMQVPAVIPLLRLAAPRVIFYGHFPDLLLAQHTSCLRRVYRAPFDLLERVTTALATRVLVNSYFTRSIYSETFGAASKAAHADVLHPCVKVPTADELQRSRHEWRQGVTCACTICCAIPFAAWSNVVVCFADSLEYLILGYVSQALIDTRYNYWKGEYSAGLQ
jgi:hypothetical protein